MLLLRIYPARMSEATYQNFYAQQYGLFYSLEIGQPIQSQSLDDRFPVLKWSTNGGKKNNIQTQPNFRTVDVFFG